jgi:catechol 2,3-dioxygenase-like lactoylglutathione lyase family enzyme
VVDADDHLKKTNAMSIKRVVPDITSDRMEESRKFYTEFLGFAVAMDMGWVVTLASPSNPTAQITFLQDTGSATPQPNLSIEVEDVDAVHARAVGLGLRLVYPLTDEPWGVRRFFVTDPNGVVINVMSHRK